MLNPKSIRYPADLPIKARREEIVAAIRGNWVLDLATETCSEGSQRDRHFIFDTLFSKAAAGCAHSKGLRWALWGSEWSKNVWPLHPIAPSRKRRF